MYQQPIRPSEMWFGPTLGGNVCNEVTWANQRLNHLCIPGYVLMQCLHNLLSRICRSLGPHFKHSVDTLISFRFQLVDCSMLLPWWTTPCMCSAGRLTTTFAVERCTDSSSHPTQSAPCMTTLISSSRTDSSVMSTLLLERWNFYIFLANSRLYVELS